MKKNRLWIWGIPLIFMVLMLITYQFQQQKWLMILIIIFNLLSYFVFGYDKNKARRGKWRIPEQLFFVWAFFGGAIGIFAGMRTFHHKTLHPSFKYGIPILVLVNILLYRWIFY
ncbi:DUF1294 domain-containing protein [Tepidibacillus infernus]|uniref:DUF1294 domain-containing protein n=1 Tax=Tepidibacillus decaturensis TaxID=1413211 RepID=A0A135L504_9BACI|nr:DUF1294 domain-containing protein [Tepidibacillus decaturensis]KXG44009.1 hypothetical protein U473_08320 [Tepidibacillus decaturensis]